MGIINNQVKSELKQLPLMLGKLFGGSFVVIGFTAIVVIQTRKIELPLMPFFFMVSMGIIIFIVSARMLAKRQLTGSAAVALNREQTRTSTLSWALLLLLAGLFILCTYIFTK